MKGERWIMAVPKKRLQLSQLSLETSHDFSRLQCLPGGDATGLPRLLERERGATVEFDLNVSQGYTDHPCQYIDHECSTKNIHLNMPGCASSTCQCRFHPDLWICHSTVAVFFGGKFVKPIDGDWGDCR